MNQSKLLVIRDPAHGRATSAAEFRGELLPLRKIASHAANIFELSLTCIKCRLRDGWTAEEALRTPRGHKIPAEATR